MDYFKDKLITINAQSRRIRQIVPDLLLSGDFSIHRYGKMLEIFEEDVVTILDLITSAIHRGDDFDDDERSAMNDLRTVFYDASEISLIAIGEYGNGELSLQSLGDTLYKAGQDALEELDNVVETYLS